MRPQISRRTLIASAGLGLGAAAAASIAPAAQSASASEPFSYCLNLATIMGQNLPIEQEVEIAAKAGYAGIEPWVRKIEDYVKRGNKLADLNKKIADLGLSVESAIGFPNWIDDDETKRAAGLEQMKREMGMVAEIGGKRIAAPAAGVKTAIELPKIAERYAKACELGRTTGVAPGLELWGRSKSLHRLGQVAYVLAEAGQPNACAILDVFHIYTGGSDFTGLQTFDGAVLPVFHLNDYPADPPRETIADADRVYPGDGVAPLDQILRTLYAIGCRGALSVELFNRTYFKQDPLEVARTALAKMKAAVRHALSSEARG